MNELIIVHTNKLKEANAEKNCRHMVVKDVYALAPFRMLAAALTMLSIEGMTSFQSLVFSPQSGLACR